ncbi:MAG: hypothetical protein K2Q26_07365 [Bdellovibrionales bacterium]|nr:hypothetical protein [Bdellovibrionales bacterium]
MRMFLLLVPLTLILARCSPSGGDGGPTDIPNVQHTCTTSKCTSAPMTMYNSVTVFSVAGCSQSSIDYQPVASGTTTVNCNGTNCNGIVSTWRDPEGNVITSIPARPYYICSWIDFNQNSIKDAADEFSVLNESVNSASVRTINQWGATAFLSDL